MFNNEVQPSTGFSTSKKKFNCRPNGEKTIKDLDLEEALAAAFAKHEYNLINLLNAL